MSVVMVNNENANQGLELFFESAMTMAEEDYDLSSMLQLTASQATLVSTLKKQNYKLQAALLKIQNQLK